MVQQRSVYHATLATQGEDRFPQVPFNVPEGAPSIGVRINFDSAAGVVDLGCEAPDGWRGWSGGARREFTISADAATPGYLPGPLTPGTWGVVLGIHNLPAGQVDVEVEVTIPSEVALPENPVVTPAPETRRGSARGLPAEPGLTWYAGDFHNHTVHSDGSRSIAELAKIGVEMGLDFLVVSDHNTTSHHPHLERIGREQGITLIPGQEVTTHRGHANAFGDIGWIDFRQDPSIWVAEVDRRGGILSINHPIDTDCSWTHRIPIKPAAVEFWHSSWYKDMISTGILSWFNGWDRDVALLGGSDFHSPEGPQRPGTPTTWVAATENTPEAILEGVRLGRTAITGYGHYDGTVITPEHFACPVLLRQGDSVLAIDAVGTVLVDAEGARTPVVEANQSFPAPKESGPYFLVLPDRTILALSA